VADHVAAAEQRQGGEHPLPDGDTAREWLATMLLIRRFEERAGEMYAKAKVGGFLHLARRRRSSARAARSETPTT
jgi:TPP-dependent pyruvate/acetoin dehydrogenase alpha subunit